MRRQSELKYKYDKFQSKRIPYEKSLENLIGLTCQLWVHEKGKNRFMRTQPGKRTARPLFRCACR